jgi:hypothetical protein
MTSQRISGKLWWSMLAVVYGLCIPISVAFAQSQTAQSIMVKLDYDNPAYEIEGTIGVNDGSNSDNFSGNNNDLAAGNVHVATSSGEWPGLTESGSYRTVVTGTLKGNAGQADFGFAVTEDFVVIGGCSCGS